MFYELHRICKVGQMNASLSDTWGDAALDKIYRIVRIGNSSIPLAMDECRLSMERLIVRLELKEECYYKLVGDCFLPAGH